MTVDETGKCGLRSPLSFLVFTTTLSQPYRFAVTPQVVRLGVLCVSLSLTHDVL